MSGRYLLDTHIFIDIAKPERNLSRRLMAILDDPSAELFLSVASVVEICIKANLGKLTLPRAIAADPARGFAETAAEAGLRLLLVELNHAATVLGLPAHHHDPFDRLLIAQAMAENLVLVSDDRAFPLYAGLALQRP